MNHSGGTLFWASMVVSLPPPAIIGPVGIARLLIFHCHLGPALPLKGQLAAGGGSTAPVSQWDEANRRVLHAGPAARHRVPKKTAPPLGLLMWSWGPRDVLHLWSRFFGPLGRGAPARPPAVAGPAGIARAPCAGLSSKTQKLKNSKLSAKWRYMGRIGRLASSLLPAT
jgi:hypothetical protein